VPSKKSKFTCCMAIPRDYCG